MNFTESEPSNRDEGPNPLTPTTNPQQPIITYPHYLTTAKPHIRDQVHYSLLATTTPEPTARPTSHSMCNNLPQYQPPTISHPRKGGLMRLVTTEIQFTLFPLGMM